MPSNGRFPNGTLFSKTVFDSYLTMWIDCHAHLAELNEAEISVIIKEAAQAGVGIIVSTATNINESRIVSLQCDRSPMFRAAGGISPFDSANPPQNWYYELEYLLSSNKKIIAVGEIGIDASNPRYPPLSIQVPMFEKQLSLAVSNNRAAVIHCRGAEKRAVEICKSMGIRRALFHCFTGSRESLEKVIDAGYYVSISGIITFPGNHLRDIVTALPPDRLLIETDSPYLAPVPHRGKKNRPAWVRFIGEETARVIGMEAPALQKQLEENFFKLFGERIR